MNQRLIDVLSEDHCNHDCKHIIVVENQHSVSLSGLMGIFGDLSWALLNKSVGKIENSDGTLYVYLMREA